MLVDREDADHAEGLTKGEFDQFLNTHVGPYSRKSATLSVCFARKAEAPQIF
jgi:hypothetical protein